MKNQKKIDTNQGRKTDSKRGNAVDLVQEKGLKVDENNKEKQTKEAKSGSKERTKENIKEKKIDLKTKKSRKYLNKFSLFGVLNLVAIIMLFMLLNELPKKALELKNHINSQIKAEESQKVNISDLEIQSNKEKAGKIIAVFPDEAGLLDFIKVIEDNKEPGSIVNFSFASKEPVRDSTTGLGIPVIIEFRGTWEEINRDLKKVQTSPYLFRPITIEVKPQLEENVIEFMYGGFLYINESFE